MAVLSSVTSHFPTPKEGFITTTASTVDSSSATTVPLNSVSGLTNGNVFVGIIDPGNAKQRAFTGIVDTSGVQITSVVWTTGSNASHTAGATVVDYVTSTAVGMISKGVLVEHRQNGTHDISQLLDDNSNELLKFTSTASAVNELTVTNAATGNGPILSATGGDTNIDVKITPKGTGRVVLNAAGAPSVANVDTAQTTSSASLTDLATTGPAATVTIGNSGMALVSFGALIQCDSADGRNYISVYMTGANSESPAIGSLRTLTHAFTGTATATTGDKTILYTGLTAGSTTFTLKYARSNGTTTFSYRHITVVPL